MRSLSSLARIQRNAIIVGAALFCGSAFAQVPPTLSTKSTSSTTTTTTSTTSTTTDATAQGQGTLPTFVDAVMTAKFGHRSTTGLAGCKAYDIAQKAIKDLKTDCGAWVKDQKESLKNRFLASTCDEACEDCSMGLKRCMVNGTIHYTVR